MNLIHPDPNIHILLLEDVPDDADLVRQALQKSGIPACIRLVDQREDYVRALEELRPDIILADHALPEFKNADALELARRRYPDVPFIFVSGAVGEERAVEAIKEGATDYVLKDHLARLGPAVRRALEECRERRERRHSDETLRLILANALDAVAAMDRRGTVTAWNPQAERVFGWSAEEAVGRPLADLVIPERLRAAHRKGLEHYLASGEGPILGRRVEMTALHRDGHEFPVELTVTPIVLDDGIWFSAFLRDISGSKRLTSRLSVEHAVAKILAEATEAAPAVSGILEAMGRGLEWDLANYWRYDPKLQTLALEESWSATPDSFAGFIDVSRQTKYARGKGLPGRVWASGTATWIKYATAEDTLPRIAHATLAGLHGAFAFPVREGGAVIGVIEVYSRREIPPDPDLLGVLEAVGSQIGQFLKRKKNEDEVRHESDERRRALEAVRDLNEQLERRVRERTSKLEEITRELDAFASTVAHDLRSPLRIMKGFSELLLEDYSGKILDPGGQEYAKKIDRASLRMTALVEDLLAYSRLSRQEVPICPVDLGDALDDVLRDMAEELRAAKAEVALRKPLPRVLGHAGLLGQVLANLLGNAVKFVAAGTPPRITVRAEEEATGRIRLWIEDNGIGIPLEYQERIFNVFERLHPQDLFPGTGLGLAIVRRAIERMGGTVGVESRPGSGSRFWIRLPRAPNAPRSGM